MDFVLNDFEDFLQFLIAEFLVLHEEGKEVLVRLAKDCVLHVVEHLRDILLPCEHRRKDESAT